MDDFEGQLFDTRDYEEPRIEAMGEHPAMTAQDWLTMADQMHDEGNMDAAQFAAYKHERARRIEGSSAFIGGTALGIN